jgi:hypothetical protein
MPHTPGSWAFSKGIDDEPDRYCVVQKIPGSPEYLIALIHNGAPGDTLKTEESNARLIAAAPALLAACKEASEWLDKRSKHYIDLGSVDVATGLWEQAHALRKAVAQAEGKEV